MMNAEHFDGQLDTFEAASDWVLAEFKRVAGRRVSKGWTREQKRDVLRELALRAAQLKVEHLRFYQREVES